MRWMLLAAMCAMAVFAVAEEADAWHRCTRDAKTNELDCGDPPNRPPRADAGPDITIAESTIIMLDACQVPPHIDDQDEIEQRCKTKDLDKDDLEYEWTLINIDYPDVLPLQPCEDECDPEDYQEAWYAPYMLPGLQPRLTLEWELKIFDRDVTEVSGICPSEDPAPEPTGCGEDAYAAWKNHWDTDTIKVHVINTNQPPHGCLQVRGGTDECMPSTRDKEEQNWINLFFTPDTVDIVNTSIPFQKKTPDRDDFREILFTVEAWDDKEVLSVQVYLYPTKAVDLWEKAEDRLFECQAEAVEPQLTFALGRFEKEVEPDTNVPGTADDWLTQLYYGQTRTIEEFKETWKGELSVDHADLVEGDYRICARAFDAEGGNGTSSPDVDFLTVVESFDRGQSPPCLSIHYPDVKPAIEPDVPEHPTAEPVAAFTCTQPARPVSTECDAFPKQVLGRGQTIRVDARIKPFGKPQDEDLYNPYTEYLMHKVTFQDVIIPEQGQPIRGPETELDRPYVIRLDTIALGAQQVHIKAYDRAGQYAQICVPVTADTSKPEQIIKVHEPYYEGVPGPFRVMLHDLVDAKVLLEIEDWGFGTARMMKCTKVDPATPNVKTCDYAGVSRYPPLDAFPHIDMNRDGIMDAVFDEKAIFDPALLANPGAWVYTHYFDYVTQTAHKFIRVDCDGDRKKDYVHDVNEDKKCDPDDFFVYVADPKKVKEFKDGLRPTLEQQSTRFGGPAKRGPDDVVSFMAIRPTWIIDFPLIPPSQGVFDYSVATSDQALNLLNEYGQITVDVYQADTQIIDVRQGDGAPFLPKDAVNITAQFAHRSTITAGQTQLPMFYTIGLTYPVDLPTDVISLYGALDEAEIAQCLPPTAPGVAPSPLAVPMDCPVGRNMHVNVTKELNLPPGNHTLFVWLSTLPSVNETDYSNNLVEYNFEVYLGRTYVNDELQFHIRAARGLPLLRQGAINLATNETYDVRLDSSGEVYQWTANNVTYFWDPDQRRDPADLDEECELDPKTQQFAPECRAITVWKAPKAEPPPVKTPGLPLAALVGLLVLARRRRAA